jgi:hypothetical protein
VRSAGVSARARSSFAWSATGEADLVGFPEPPGKLRPMRARPADVSLTGTRSEPAANLAPRRPPPFDNAGRPRRARCARAGHRAPVTTHSTVTAMSLMGLYRSPATPLRPPSSNLGGRAPGRWCRRQSGRPSSRWLANAVPSIVVDVDRSSTIVVSPSTNRCWTSSFTPPTSTPASRPKGASMNSWFLR